ncbi:hypothetical protein HYR69_07840, partial [Candidatus Sumerlaeota bacterium]|nr:hypothetical protein [Candidatus Sumerlaeota bacterium]
VPASMREVLDMYKGLEKGVVETLDDFFIFARLTFVRHVEHMDAFERAFALYFYGIDIPRVAEGDLELLRTKQFQKWLAEAIKKGEVPKTALWTMTPQELMKKFWETVREQMEAHHGGSKWVGTGGNSPFGHSGNAQRGVRVMGGYGNRSALKVIGDRRYIDYSETNQLKGENIRQALDAMKHMKKQGARDQLNLDETIRVTAKNGGEIDLVFDRELRDKISVCILIDNGGYSMYPYIDLTRLLFSKLHDRFKDITTYYFHNTIYGSIFTDAQRRVSLKTDKFLEKKDDTRVVIIGDASMAPEELESAGGSISFGSDDAQPSTYWLKRIAERFKYSTWLNPIPREEWTDTYGQWTLTTIRGIFHMEDMTLRGIKGMVKHLTRHKTE